MDKFYKGIGTREISPEDAAAIAMAADNKIIEQLQDEYSYKTCVNFEGNDEVEAFYGRVEGIYRDEDGDIVVSLRDMDDDVWDVSWNEIKDQEFDSMED